MTIMIQLCSSDGEIFVVPIDVAKMSLTIRGLLSDLEFDEAEADRKHEPIPLQNASASVLKKVIEWCSHHKDQAPSTSETISAWDREFFNIPQGQICAIISAAYYLDIDQLTKAGCKVLAGMIRGKTTEQIRQIFGLENDFTPEEEEQIRRENAWNED